MNVNKDNAEGFGIGLLVGVILGGAVALLYAPKSGRETREDIKRQADIVSGDIKRHADNVSRIVRSKLGKGTLKDVKGE